MKHNIVITFRTEKSVRRLPLWLHLKKCIEATLEAEGVRVPCEINVLVADNKTIRAINRAYRNIDRETDVLSFPMFQFEPGKLPEDLREYLDPETGMLPLGDMAISYEKAEAQAKEFGHSTKRELGYLTIHSILHLLGYDHMDEGPMKKQMRAREEAICKQIDLER
ncbi:MAG: rRNA maturation RNase YbeY [Oscillospiraceae bacterium]|nr:rRNA maturation RNase YbeY [Oscillospiraceae bacterium]